MKTRISGSFLGLGALSLLAAPHFVGVASAQETLAGLGAASSIGAGIGAGAAVSSLAVPNFRGAGGANGDDKGTGVGNASPTAIVNGATEKAPEEKKNVIAPESFGINAKRIVSQLRNAPSLTAPQGGLPRYKETKLERQRRLARLTPEARKKAIQNQYKIPPVGWLGRYLPQDRYKFGKDWIYVSTEDTKYYFTPQGLALHKFNPNRVIGFRTWQDAMLAGYKPDPLTKPAPAPEIIQLAKAVNTPPSKMADPEDLPDLDIFYKYVEYLYAGQVSDASARTSLLYAQVVYSTLGDYAPTRWQARARALGVLEVAIGEKNYSDLPAVAGSRAFEAKLQSEKDAIRSAVEAHNDRVWGRAIELAYDYVFPLGTVRRAVADLRRADYYVETGDVLSKTSFIEVQLALPMTLNTAQKEIGPLRNSEIEISAHVDKIKAGALSRVSGNMLPFPGAPKVIAAGFVKKPVSGKVNEGPKFSPHKEPWVRNGYWKFVSSDVSKTAYKPNDPRVLSIPANRIVGFTSYQEVLDSGYKLAEGGGISLSAELRRAQAGADKRRQDQARKAAAAAAAAAKTAQAAPATGQPAAGQPAAGQPAPATP